MSVSITPFLGPYIVHASLHMVRGRIASPEASCLGGGKPEAKFCTKLKSTIFFKKSANSPLPPRVTYIYYRIVILDMYQHDV